MNSPSTVWTFVTPASLALLATVVKHLLVNVHCIHDPVGGDRLREWNGKRPGAGADIGHDVAILQFQLFDHLIYMQVDDAPGPFHAVDVIFRFALFQLG